MKTNRQWMPLFLNHIVLNILLFLWIGLSAYAQTEAPSSPHFLMWRGFYNDPFELSISADDEGAVIKYTLNGSDPRTAPNATISTSPCKFYIDPEDTTGRDISPAVIVRAVVCLDDTVFSEVITHSYFFIGKAAELSPDGQKPGPGWPEPDYNRQYINYGLDPDVLNDPKYRDKLSGALLSIPTISLVTDVKNLFDPKTGIYVNALRRGAEWERPASIELIYPDGKDGFQINAGLRIRGGYSRNAQFPKHAFRLFFREEYGASKLKYPLFGDEGVDEFDKIDLRTSQNYAWSRDSDQGAFNTMNRDVYSRDVQRDMGQPYTRSRYYHLYINGSYWGIFQTQERPEARFAASYLGGSSDDYDVVKVATDKNYAIEATDGNLDAWQSVWNLCEKGFSDPKNYQTLFGLDAEGNRDPSLIKLVDIDNLIDYMIVIFQTGNFDAPVSKFFQNTNPNNFYAIYNRNNPDGFKFFAHDCEHTLFTSPYASPGIGLYEDRVNIGDLDDYYKMTVTNFNKFHPQWLHYRLTENADYRLRFADRVYKHFFNNGIMTPGKNINRFMARAEEIDEAIIAESARWGDAMTTIPRTKDNDWLPQIDNIVDNFFPYRNEIVMEQFRVAGLYPDLDPPLFFGNQTEMTAEMIAVEPGFKLAFHNPNSAGYILVTTDSTDPRQLGGLPSLTAVTITESDSITISSTTHIKARVMNYQSWSPLHEITFSTRDDLHNLKVTEIHYHPLDSETINGREFEFIELKNTGTTPLNLTSAVFTNGIDYTFPAGTLLEPDQFVVLASNRQAFKDRYNFYPFGDYTGQLDNAGERIVFISAAGDTVINIRYNDRSPWPVEPDSLGYSLVPTEYNPTDNQNDPANWRTSRIANGSPGRDDDETVSVKTEQLPDRFGLFQNYPNPFNPETTISYALAKEERVTLTIYNARGQKIRMLTDQTKSAGNHTAVWDARDDAGQKAPSGIYICQIKTMTMNRSIKMVLMR